VKLISESKIDHQSRDVFVYFDNDAKVYTPSDAIRLAERVGVKR
jgi:uncharacterized protein YecE (DUF72 family)